MTEIPMTYFASPERASEEELALQVKLMAEAPLIKSMFDSVPVLVAVLNGQRQIVYANKAFSEFLQTYNVTEVTGKRPGEAVNCVHASEMPGGCGTSLSCSVCGAVNAILESQKSCTSRLECRITLANGDSLDLLVLANQYVVGSSEFTIFAASDISDQKRRKSLERIFFHDLLNITGALKGFLEILNDCSVTERDEYIHFSRNITEHLIDEIMAQKELTQAEDNELKLNIQPFSTLYLLKEVAMLYEKHMVSLGKKIAISPNAEDIIMKGDKTILRRVLGNLVKNALEAINEGDVVSVNCSRDGNEVEFTVINNAEIPQKIQLQIFQRSYSTKGAGRGLGTYSVKLLTERYLKGKVHFTSDSEGTVFYVRLPMYLDDIKETI